MGRPAGGVDEGEGSPDAAIGICITFRIDFRRSQEEGPGQRAPASPDEGIGHAHPSQITHQRKKRAVANGPAVGIDDRQGEARALHQRAYIAHIRKRDDAWTDPAVKLGFRLKKHVLEFGECARSRNHCKKEAVGPQRPPCLDEHAGGVVREMQAERGENEVCRFRLQWQNLQRCRGNGRIGPCEGIRQFNPAKHADLAGCQTGFPGRPGPSVQLHGNVETALNDAQPLGQFIRGELHQEVGTLNWLLQGTPAPDGNKFGVEKRIHDGDPVAVLLSPCRTKGTSVNRMWGRCGGKQHMRMANLPWQSVGRVWSLALDFVYPAICAGCGIMTGSHRGLCGPCWSTIPFIERPFCEVLGIPFVHDQGEGAISPKAMASQPVFDRLRAVAAHRGIVRRLVHSLKYKDRTELAPMMATWMARAGAEELRKADAIIPVPLHRWRLFLRRYNQAAELSREIARQSGVTHLPRSLVRKRATKRQVGLGRRARLRNVEGAFEVPAENRDTVLGRRIILVDDVFTTGATVNAAARALKRAGALEVTVLTFAMAFAAPI